VAPLATQLHQKRALLIGTKADAASPARRRKSAASAPVQG
jgi:hypothetical protein